MKNPSINKASIVVLPFRNISSNGEMDYFSDGITEEIIFGLSKIEQLKVISKTSSFFFKDHKGTLQEIAEHLNVSIVLEGSVRFAGDMIRITAQLIDVQDDSHLWSSAWNRKLENIFEIQNEISLLIADKLREQFGHMEIAERIAETPTQNLNAYDHFLKGKKLFNKWNPANVQEAIIQYEAALRLDANLIEAHVGLADGYSFLAVAGFAPREESWRKAILHLEKADAIDPDNASLNFMRANQALFTEADFAQSMLFIKRSIANKPSHSDAHRFISFLYSLRNEFKQAEVHIQYAKSIDPLNEETKFYEAYLLYREKKYTPVRNILEKLMANNPQNVPVLILLSYILLKTEDFQSLEKLLLDIPTGLIMPDERLGIECLSLALQGIDDEMHPKLQMLKSKANRDSSFQAHIYLFHYYCIKGKFDEAFQLVEKLFDNKSSIFFLAFTDPLAENIQNDSRYPSYWKRVYPSIAEKPIPKRSNTSSLDEDTAILFQERLSQFMKQEQPFLNPSLSLRSLAAQIDIHPNQLSWLLNERLGKNFNEFINHFRVEHFKSLVVAPKNSHISLIGLAYESGFNSKTAFNTTFKKLTGTTPGAYLKEQSS
ncbi:MAG: helix-turn-helix domain-containing protein [Bacteroidia bacterium]|nr:helix-turn-helix domain-containing protein [Bacteroidia bacterium]